MHCLKNIFMLQVNSYPNFFLNIFKFLLQTFYICIFFYFYKHNHGKNIVFKDLLCDINNIGYRRHHGGRRRRDATRGRFAGRRGDAGDGGELVARVTAWLPDSVWVWGPGSSWQAGGPPVSM